MKPGDIIEWVYIDDLKPVIAREHIFSSTMKCWIPADGQMLLISIVGSTIYFLRKEGLFHALVDEAKQLRNGARYHPQVIQRIVIQ